MLVGLLGAALATPADACPRGARCIAMRSGPAELSSIGPAVDAPADRQARLRSSLSSFHPSVAHPDDVEMPWFWAVLAAEAHDRLPRYEQDEQFSLVLSPVVVSMPSESTPGLGLSGAF